MKPAELAGLRLKNQYLARKKAVRPAAVLEWMGAMQAQDFHAAKWGIGLRTEGGCEAGVDQAIQSREIIRCWMLRGTLHFVSAQDYRWMLKLLAPRVIEGAAKRRMELGLDDKLLARCRKIFVKALQKEKQLGRDQLTLLLTKSGIEVDVRRSYHIYWNMRLSGLLCFGPHQGKQPSFVLAEDWVPAGGVLPGEEALARLALKYFQSHGPATLADFIWWSGLKAADARAALAGAAKDLQKENTKAGEVWFGKDCIGAGGGIPPALFLPAFDEYLLGYSDRSAVLKEGYFEKIVPGSNGIFLPMMAEKGKIVGTWKREMKKDRALLRPIPFEDGWKASAAWKAAGRQYEEYLGLPVVIQGVG